MWGAKAFPGLFKTKSQTQEKPPLGLLALCLLGSRQDQFRKYQARLSFLKIWRCEHLAQWTKRWKEGWAQGSRTKPSISQPLLVWESLWGGVLSFSKGLWDQSNETCLLNTFYPLITHSLWWFILNWCCRVPKDQPLMEAMQLPVFSASQLSFQSPARSFLVMALTAAILPCCLSALPNGEGIYLPSFGHHSQADFVFKINVAFPKIRNPNFYHIQQDQSLRLAHLLNFPHMCV